jgi:hypothetical protein
MQQWRKAMSGGETTLSGTDDFSTSLSYVVGAEQVFINGVLLERGVDYTATTGTSITGLSALIASDIATVISHNSFNIANAIQSTQIAAKGDLIVGTGSGTYTNQGVGADGTTLVANSSVGAGVSWTTPTASLANPFINGGFDFFQRGTSVAATASTSSYTADRWQTYSVSSNATVSQQSAIDTTYLPNIRYCGRFQRNNGSSATGAISTTQNFESSTAIPFAGKTITVSFYARAGSGMTNGNILSYLLVTGTGTDQNLQAGYTGASNAITGSATLTSNWQRFVATATLPTTTTEFAFNHSYTPSGTAGASDYYEITGVQIDLGTYTATTAPTFRRAGGTLQGELAACQRYYWRSSLSAAAAALIGLGIGQSTTVALIGVKLPITMRTTPSSTVESSGLWLYDGTATFNSSAGITSGGGMAADNNMMNITATVGSGLTQYRPYYLYAATTSAYLGISAEL